MTTSASPVGQTPAPLNLASRFIGIIFSPRPTYESVAAAPKWVGMLVVTTLIAAIFNVLPLTTEDGRQAAVEKQIGATKSVLQAFGRTMTPEVEAQIEASVARLPYRTGISIIVFSPIVTAVIAGICFVIFKVALGGESRFKQVFAVVVHAGVISALSALFSGIVNYFRGGIGGVTNLSALLPMVSEQSFIGNLLGTIDIFLIWWIIALAVGLAVLYRRRTQPIALSFFGLYALIAIVIAVVKSSMGGA